MLTPTDGETQRLIKFVGDFIKGTPFADSPVCIYANKTRDNWDVGINFTADKTQQAVKLASDMLSHIGRREPGIDPSRLVLRPIQDPFSLEEFLCLTGHVTE